MSMQIFLGHGFEKYHVNDAGEPDESGKSNYEIGQEFRKAIERIGGTAVRVVGTEDPINSTISEAVKRSIDQSDAVICVFPKRVRCPHSNDWTTSQYVISESGYAASRFRHEADRRLFGFIEDGVNRSNLGLAFPNDRTVPNFHRENLPDIWPRLEEVVRSILHTTRPPTDEPEPVLLHKTVQVLRNGRALIKTLYRFRLRRGSKKFRMRHTFWRVREALPDIRRLLEARPSESVDFFRCLPKQCGCMDIKNVQIELLEPKRARHKKEIGFVVEMRNIELNAGDFVEYQFAYSYDDAFFDPRDLRTWELNSAGLRTGGRGVVRETILTILFERNWAKSESMPAIEPENGYAGPRVATANATDFPAHIDPCEFWHRQEGWTAVGCMDPCLGAQSPLVEAYEWKAEDFVGMMKATWVPGFNYHPQRVKRSARPGARRRNNRSGR